MILGLDISHHQGTQPPLAWARAEGIEFVVIKSTEGASYVDPRFADNLRRARAAGLLVAAYHYVRSSATAAEQVANVRRAVPRDVPVIPDVEANSGTLPRVRDLVYLLREAGYHVPLLYLPRWYWQELGRPSLAGLPPLWSSRYPDNVVDDLRDELARVPSSYWDGYGGLNVAVLQFTSSARIAGYAPLDANAFRGTRTELLRLLGYQREDDNVRNLTFGRSAPEATEVWVGDGLRRRLLENQTELDGLQFWVRQRSGDAEVHVIADLRVLGEVDPAVVPVQIDYARFLDEVSERVTDGVVAALEARGVAGATVDEVMEVVRTVFRDAGTTSA